jgi:hypothetical protein
MRLERNNSERVERGAILLEVVLALVLFAAAATVIGIALNAALGSVDRLRFSAHAADRSLTVFSELQLGIRSLADLPPTNESTNAWTIEIIGKPWSGASADLGGTLSSGAPLTEVEVVIRHESGFVHRARQVMRLKSAAGALAVRPDTKPGGLAAR